LIDPLENADYPNAVKTNTTRNTSSQEALIRKHP
jgi:hypothetical protein